jgi:hypothetical protein
MLRLLLYHFTYSLYVICIYCSGHTKPGEVDPVLLCPIFDIFACCLPSRLRRFLRCYIDYDNVSKTRALTQGRDAATCFASLNSALYIEHRDAHMASTIVYNHYIVLKLPAFY